MSRWLVIVGGAIAFVAILFGIRATMVGRDTIATVRAETVPTLDKPVSGSQTAKDGMPVVVLRSVAEVRPLYVSLSGRTEAARTVTVKSEAAGVVQAVEAVEGRIVAKGDLLCGLDMAGASAKVREAEAEVRAQELKYNAAKELVEKGWAAPARLQGARAGLDAAQAALQVARNEQSKTQIRSPFRGFLERRVADVGEFLGPGDACGVVVQLDPILVIAEATEQNASKIRVDAPARLRLSDGAETRGHVRYLARTADATTRAWRVEVELANEDGAIPVGRVAEVRIQTGQGDAHRVKPELLTLDQEGRIGLRYLDVGGVVSFIPADVVDESPDGVWIAGLPREALIVAEGQDAVKPGIRATPVFQETLEKAP